MATLTPTIWRNAHQGENQIYLEERQEPTSQRFTIREKARFLGFIQNFLCVLRILCPLPVYDTVLYAR